MLLTIASICLVTFPWQIVAATTYIWLDHWRVKNLCQSYCSRLHSQSMINCTVHCNYTNVIFIYRLLIVYFFNILVFCSDFCNFGKQFRWLGCVPQLFGLSAGRWHKLVQSKCNGSNQTVKFWWFPKLQVVYFNWRSGMCLMGFQKIASFFYKWLIIVFKWIFTCLGMPYVQFNFRLSTALSFVQNLQMKGHNDCVRCPYLATIEIERRRRLNGKADDFKLMEVLLNYFNRCLLIIMWTFLYVFLVLWLC